MRTRFSLVEFSVDHPYWVLAIVLAITAVALTQFPKVETDTNPKNMLPPTSDVRVWNSAVEQTFGLYEDMLVVGVQKSSGVLNTATLGRLATLEAAILKIEGVAARDVSGFTTTDNITVEGDSLRVAPLMEAVPQTEAELAHMKAALLSNPLLVNRLISADATVAAIYVPLEKGANGKDIADRIRALVQANPGDERYYIAGDPVARDTFGAEMFLLMAIFAPIAALVMFLVRYMMFGDLFLSIALMMDAMISIVWSIGLLIGLGYPIHIMSSMAPVFLMAIATDSIHIFNEFYFRYRETHNRRQAIIETMHAVQRPVQYTALATAAGFAVLMFMNVVPVKVFGGLVAFGTIMLRMLSFSFIPAMFALVPEKNLVQAAAAEDSDAGWSARTLRRIASLGGRRPWTVVGVSSLLMALAIWGLTRINVNNNMVEWFKSDNEVRIADHDLNQALGGTSLAYIVADGVHEDFMKNPEALRSIEALQRRLETLPVVGKTTSVVDFVKRINRVLHNDDPAFDKIPDSQAIVAQYLFLFDMSAKPSDLGNVVDPTYQKANIWVQLKTWDATAMRQVDDVIRDYKAPAATPMTFKPAGIAYFNLVWNDEVLWDMVEGFLVSLVIIFVILAFNFRSIAWAIIGYLPLLFTVALIYATIGFLGRDFDMPVSVLSCLSLGMAVDFAIHFISRFREHLAATGAPGTTPTREELLSALEWTAARPGKGIVRNAILFAASFSVMLFASLTPYISVGAFIVSMMTISALMTILGLPALIMIFRAGLFKSRPAATPSVAAETASGPHPGGPV